ncbi:hypothetical protein ACRYCC_09115 [Actinomadura scrupuli]|uniref:hypothetical protein n=1 Tax=Actinomadura scrupuli TaxID=559629 RepID=UPI003D9827CF
MSEMPPNPSGTPRYTRTQRRLLTVSAGLGVAVLAGVAFVVTYADLRALVVEGHAPRRFAPAYPVMFDVLITVTILALVVARNTRWWVRWPRWLLLLVLLAGAAAASVQRATKGYAALPDDALRAGVAVAPHVMLLLAIWLWLAMFKQARAALARRAARPGEGSPAGDDGPAPDGEGAGAPDTHPDHETGRPPAETAADAQEPAWRGPWAPEEPPAEAALDWALVPYDPEPAPYEPDPAIQPYERDPLRAYEADPIPNPIPEPAASPEPVTSREPAASPEPFAIPEPAAGPDPFAIPEPAAGQEPIAFSEPRAISEPPVGSEPIPGPAAGPEPEPEPEPVTFGKPPPQASLPTDIKLVGRPAATTRPDIVMPGAAEPDAGAALWATDPPPESHPQAAPPASDLRTEPVTGGDPASGGDEDGADVPVVDRAEDPDAGDDPLVPGRTAGDADPEGAQSTTDDVERWSAEAAEDARRWSEDTAEGLRTDRPGLEPERTGEVEWRPPSSTFRSSPTPPDE